MTFDATVEAALMVRFPAKCFPCLLAHSVVQALLRTARRISEVRHETKTVTIEYESAAREER